MKQGVAHEILMKYRVEVIVFAAILQENESGVSIRELAERIGVSKSTLHRWLTKARDRRAKNPEVELFDAQGGSPFSEGKDCGHTEKFWLGKRRVCIRCLMSNFEDDPVLARAGLPVAGSEPKKPAPKFKPKGSKTKAQAVA